MQNRLYHGDNLFILREHVEDASVDLVYLDPPFNSRRAYHLAAGHSLGTVGATPPAFADTWTWNENAYLELYRTYRDERFVRLVRAFADTIGRNGVTAYLVMMGPRLLELHRVLRPTGSLYLHCDPAAGHYLKLLLDCIFGPASFRREIVWRSGWVSGYKSSARNWIRNHDTILYYLRDPGMDSAFELPFRPHAPGYRRRGGRGNARGVPMDDVWTDIYSPNIMSFSKEKLGYPTQKPLALLERIISASSRPGDVVLDPFCGSGTTLVAARTLGRSWIGIDTSEAAIALAQMRLADSDGADAPSFAETSIPPSPPGDRARG